jgi:hypothetical protein
VTDIYVPEAGQAIDELAAVRRPQRGAFAFDPDERALLIIGMKQRVDDVFLI